MMPRPVLTAIALLIPVMARPPLITAQQQSAPHIPVRGGGNLELRAVKVTDARIDVDGRPDEAAWRGAQWLRDFVTKDPVEGGRPTERTEVAFIYDDDALYVGARMWTADPTIVRALVSRRDEDVGISDMLVISLDTYRDRRTAYTFAVDAAGSRKDWFHPSDNEYHWEMSYDPVWQAAVTRDSAGWYAEMRIPFDQLRFNDQTSQVWGVNVNRWIPARNEDIFWTYVPKDDTGWSSWLGALVGIEGIRPSRRIELLPYVASSSIVTGDRDPSDPFDDGFNETVRVGGDFKMGLGPNLTLDATVNPDFGQVEADPAEVNLTAFETFFDERRPFFIEGARLFDGGGAGFYYSRRIGARPGGSASGDYVDRPAASTIIGATKVTGRMGSGLSVGALGALTAREHARTFDVASGNQGSVEVAPLTGYSVLSLQQEFGPYQSTGNLILTGVRRDVSASDPLGQVLARQAYTGGTQWDIRFAENRYSLNFDLGFSYVEGSQEAMAGIQTSPVHYFQRPDQDHVTFDPTRTSLFGYSAGLSIEKQTGRHFLWETGINFESPGLEINDMGRLGTADGIDGFTFAMFRETTPGRVFRDWSIGAVAFYGWNYGLTRQYSGASTFFNARLPNFMRVGLDLGYSLSGLSQTATRGGPLMRTGANWDIGFDVSSNFAARNRWRASTGYFRSRTGSRSASVRGGVVIKPSARWSISVDPTYRWLIEARQYVATLPNGPAATFDTRYVFAFVERTQLSAQIRVNFAITPDLTIEGYAEPFAASGRFYDFGELVAAPENTLRTYGTDGTTLTQQADGSYTVDDAGNGDSFGLRNPDFNIFSFRSNLVVRWEWRPGSTLFLVWQQDRFAFEPTGRRVRPGGLLDALSATGDNFLALKISYWIG